MRKRHVVVLSEPERAQLHTMIGRGVAPASALTHARILLKANQGEAGPGWTDAAIGAALEVNPATVARDVAAAGRSAGGAAGDRVGVVGDGSAGLAANRLKPWLTEALVHPTRARRRVRLAHGGRAGGLHPAL